MSSIESTDPESQNISAAAVSPQKHTRSQERGNGSGRHHLPAWRSPMVQIIAVGLIEFLNPGMYNALAGLGGAGQVNPHAQNLAGVALHITFAVVGFFVGIPANALGVKWTMAIGGIGYALYSGAFLCYNHTQNVPFVIAAGSILGFCAAFLWCAQGIVMMSYPTENQRGKAIAITMTLFNLGAVIGAAGALGQNWHVKVGHVTDGTYAAFIILEVCGALLCCCLARTDTVVRKDGSRVQVEKLPGIKDNIIGLWTTLRTDLWVLLLFPMFFSSTYFYTYQFNDVNAYWFNTRTRSFNNMFYWISQILGTTALGFFLDWQRFSRKSRIRIAWVVMFVFVNSTWGGGAAFVMKTNRAKKSPKMDIYDRDYIWYLILYMCYGFMDSLWQTYVYYTIGAMTNDPRKVAYYTGFYKSIQAAGATVISHLDASKYPFSTEFASCWGLLVGALLCALPVYIWRIKDTEMAVEHDTIGTETRDEVVAGGAKTEWLG